VIKTFEEDFALIRGEDAEPGECGLPCPANATQDGDQRIDCCPRKIASRALSTLAGDIANIQTRFIGQGVSATRSYISGQCDLISYILDVWRVVSHGLTSSE
jgi:hypothetical protein